MKFFVVIVIVFVLFVGSLAFKFHLDIDSQNTVSGGDFEFGLGLSRKMFVLENDVNTMISPFALWSALVLLVEASAADTRHSLLSTLHLKSDEAARRAAFKISKDLLEINTTTVRVSLGLNIFVGNNLHVKESFQKVMRTNYDSEVQPLNFSNTQSTLDIINNIINITMRGSIKKSVKAKYLKKAQLLITSSLYFRGKWKIPFNSSQTQEKPFHDMYGKPSSKVEMMATQGPFRCRLMPKLEAFVLELPYGNGKQVSMLALLPNLGVSVDKVLQNVEKIRTSNIFNELPKKRMSDVIVYLPRFKTTTKISLKKLLKQLRFKDDFVQGRANFSGVANGLHMADIVHTSQIIVSDENGVASFLDVNYFPELFFDRPFLYLVVENVSKLIIFVGKFTNGKSS